MHYPGGPLPDKGICGPPGGPLPDKSVVATDRLKSRPSKMAPVAMIEVIKRSPFG